MDIVEIFRSAADAEKAAGMSAYMKNRFRFLGLNRPVRDALQSELLRNKRAEKEIDWEWVSKLYDQPEREFHYLAVDYLRKSARKLKKEDISRLEVLVRTHSWWDTVDALSVIIGELVSREPGLKENVLRDWVSDSDMWVRRVSLLFQLKFRHALDKDFLEFAIAGNLGSTEFFINKAIGWILREYSKTDPKWVRDFLDRFELSGLSRREASRYL